jgi:putative NIF3 family GTP cyclohydrolase 1 type 2
MVEDALAAGAHVYVSGDLKYHEAARALEGNMALIDVGHFASERLIVRPLAEMLQARAQDSLQGLQVFAACDERDPFWFS